MRQLQDFWNKSKKVILNAVGITSLIVGTIAFFLPGIPGWPFLIFGSFCLKLAKDIDQENEFDAI